MPGEARDLVERLRAVSTATLTMQLIKRGIRRSWIAGTRPLFAGIPRIAGEAYTLRFLPMREDISTRESYARAGSLREAIERADFDAQMSAIRLADAGTKADAQLAAVAAG